MAVSVPSSMLYTAEPVACVFAVMPFNLALDYAPIDESGK